MTKWLTLCNVDPILFEICIGDGRKALQQLYAAKFPEHSVGTFVIDPTLQ